MVFRKKDNLLFSKL